MTKAKQKLNGIYYRHWALTGDPSGVVLIVHGLGEHCERYNHVADALNSAGYAVASLDLPGHGQSEGTRGYVQSFSDYQDAVLNLYKQMTEAYPNLPIFLFGHSMGGLIATRLLIDQQDLFAAAMLSGPAIQSPQEPPAFQVAIIKMISALFPKLGMMTLDASGISRDPQVVADYMQDPLVNKGKLSARLLKELFANMQFCKEHAEKISLPILILHGGQDAMTAPAGSELLFNKVSSKDKELKIYDDLLHEILNEPEGDEVAAKMIAWLDNH